MKFPTAPHRVFRVRGAEFRPLSPDCVRAANSCVVRNLFTSAALATKPRKPNQRSGADEAVRPQTSRHFRNTSPVIAEGGPHGVTWTHAEKRKPRAGVFPRPDSSRTPRNPRACRGWIQFI